MSSAVSERTPESGLIRALSSRFEIDSEGESRLEAACSPLEGNTDNRPHTTPASVGLSAVSTLVCRGKDDITGTGYVVPTFAVHWGVIVRDFLFHLQYNSKTKAVEFDVRSWRSKNGNSRRYDVDEVGKTPYSTDEINDIGKKLVDAFGDYHTLFWNCQTFVKVFLRVICTPAAESGHWTTADTTYLFLCAFAVSAPLASTTRTVEEERIKRLIKAVTEKTLQEDDLITASQTAIDFLEHQALAEPENQAELASLREPKQSKTSMNAIDNRFLSTDLDCIDGYAPELF